jgi:hypothetical protein
MVWNQSCPIFAFQSPLQDLIFVEYLYLFFPPCTRSFVWSNLNSTPRLDLQISGLCDGYMIDLSFVTCTIMITLLQFHFRNRSYYYIFLSSIIVCARISVLFLSFTTCIKLLNPDTGDAFDLDHGSGAAFQMWIRIKGPIVWRSRCQSHAEHQVRPNMI